MLIHGRNRIQSYAISPIQKLTERIVSVSKKIQELLKNTVKKC